MVVDYLITIFISLLNNYVYANWPADFSFFRYADYSLFLDQVLSFLVNALSAVSNFFPTAWYLGIILAIASSVVVLAIFKGVKALVNFFRGSGA